MKRILFTILAVIAFVACQAQSKAKLFPFGIKVLGNTEVATVDVDSRFMLLDADKESTEISYANLLAQIGAGADVIADDSPEQDIEFWMGNTLQFGGRTPLSNTVYFVLDSVPPLPDIVMTKPVYDVDDNDVVDLAETVEDNAITNSKMADNAIGNPEMADNAIGTLELQANSVTLAKAAADFYDADVFSPTIIDGDAAGSYTYTVDKASYVKIGNHCTFVIEFSNINTTGTPTGAVIILGFPFNADGSFIFKTLNSGGDVGFSEISTSLTSGTSIATLVINPASGTTNNAAYTGVTYTSGTITISGSYLVQ